MKQLELWPNNNDCACQRCTCDEGLVDGHYPVFGETKECDCVECTCETCHNEEKIEYYWECNAEELLDSE